MLLILLSSFCHCAHSRSSMLESKVLKVEISGRLIGMDEFL
jgi:hypothetical protein